MVTDPLLDTPPYELAPDKPMGADRHRRSDGAGKRLEHSPRITNQVIAAFSDDLNYVHGHHSFKFGALYNHYNNHIYAAGYDKDNVVMATSPHFSRRRYRNMTGILPGSNFARTFLYDTMGFYAQDAWRLTPRLTLNLGMRYEPITEIIDADGLSSSLRNPLTDTAFTLGPEFAQSTLRGTGDPGSALPMTSLAMARRPCAAALACSTTRPVTASGGLVLGAGVSPPGILQYTLTNIP